jgi:Ca2+/H+ antiporter, TMEM165/GDT1 family
MAGDGPSEELQEVEEELVKKKGESNEADDEDTKDIELQNENGSHKRSNNNRGTNLLSLSTCLGIEHLKVFTQAFTLTFLAEWGDRSQIATIALASHQNPFGVVIGGLLGHAFCTGMAVIGGRMLAARISERTVAIIGGVLFLFFAVTSFLWGPDAS